MQTDLLWERVERGGRTRFSLAYDARMNSLEAQADMVALQIPTMGIRITGARFREQPRTSPLLAVLRRRQRGAKGRDVWYEVWNEPDIGLFWLPKSNARGIYGCAALKQ